MAATNEYKERELVAKKLLAEEPDITDEEVVLRSGISINRIRKLKDQAITPPPDTEESGATLTFAESPQPLPEDQPKEDVFSKAKNSLFESLGIKSSDKKEEPKPHTSVATKLNKRQQDFVTNFSPITAYGFILAASWAWGRMGPEYAILAPTDEVATHITAPLVRIYARHSKLVAAMNPDQIDGLQALFALIGYVHTSYQLYNKMKAEEDQDEFGSYERGYRKQQPGASTAENRINGRGLGQPTMGGATSDVQGVSGLNGHDEFERGDLTAKEVAEHEALLRLSDLDFASRARRSGRYNELQQ